MPELQPVVERRTPVLDCGARVLDLSVPQVMGVLNVTPASFSDGGQFIRAGGLDVDKVLYRVEQMLEEGATIVDIGGESTRPGASAISLEVEMRRVLPVVAAVKQRFDVFISVDTSAPQLMLEAATLGADIINDVRALECEGAVDAAVKSKLAVCLMHMLASPDVMQDNPSYQSVVTDVSQYLSQRIACCTDAGISVNKLLIDPGFGFGKTPEHNLCLLKYLSSLGDLGVPVLAGLSRKSVIGHVLGREVDQRLAGSLALALMAVNNGASIVRVHDIAETVDVIKLWHAVQHAG